MAAIQFTEATKAYPRTIAPAGKYPIVGDRIYRTLQDAQDYVDGKSSSKSAIPGIYLSVIDDGINNGAYWVEQAAGYDGATVGVLRKMGAGGGGGGDISLAWDDITGKPSFADVATSGSYNDLTDKPTIPSLDGYATQQWVSNQGFAVATSLGALAYKGSLSWSEIVDRPTKLSNFTNDAGFITSAALAGYLKEEDAETIYITEEEAEDRYVKRGGDSINGDISFGGSIKIGGATLSWDEASHALKVDTSFYSTKQLASGGIGDASGSGLGLILNEWPTDSEDYSKYALGGNLGIELNTRLTAVEGKATNVTVSPTLSQGKPMGTIMVDGVSQTMYAPASYSADDIVPTQERNFVSLQDIEYWNTAYLPKTGGTISANDQSPLSVKSTSGTSSYIRFESVMGTIGYIGIGGDRKPSFMTHDGTAYKLLNTGDVSGTLTGSLVPDKDGAYHLGSSSYRMGVVFALQGVFYGGLSINHESVATQTWADGRYLKLSGGTIESSSSSSPLIIKTSSNAWLMFQNASGYLGEFGYSYDKIAKCTDASGAAKIIIHSGNIGSYKAGDSDKLGGLSASSYIATKDITGDLNAADLYGSKSFVLNLISSAQNVPSGMNSGEGIYIAGYDTGFMLLSSYHQDKLMYRRGFNSLSSNEILSNAWKTIAFTDSNVASATKLETARTIWGQSFDGTGNVSGNLHLGNSGDFEIGTGYGSSNTTRYNRIVIGNATTGIQYYSGGWTSANVIAHDFKVGQNSTSALMVCNSGNVTIGSSDLAGTAWRFYVDGGARIGDITMSQSSLGLNRNVNTGAVINNSYAALWLDTSSDRGTIHFTDTTGVRRSYITLATNGVGIGTSNPQYKLDVNGDGRFSGATFFVGSSNFEGALYGPTSGGTYRRWRLVTDRSSNGTYIQAASYDGTSVSGNLFLTGYNAGELNKCMISAATTVISKALQIGNAILSWDGTNNALKIEGNVYVTGQVSAGGVGTAN